MKLLIFFFETEFFFLFLVETQFRCNHRWTMEKSQILHHWTLFPHGYHLEYHSHLGHFCTPYQYWQLWKLPCKLWLQNCTSSMGLKSLGLNHSVWKSPKKSHSTLRAKRVTFTFWVDKSSLKMPKMINLASFWKSDDWGQTVLPDRSILIRQKW